MHSKLRLCGERGRQEGRRRERIFVLFFVLGDLCELRSKQRELRLQRRTFVVCERGARLLLLLRRRSGVCERSKHGVEVARRTTGVRWSGPGVCG